MKNKKANCEKYERNVGRKGHGWRVGKLALILFGLVWGDSIGNTPLERERERKRYGDPFTTYFITKESNTWFCLYAEKVKGRKNIN